MPQDRDAERSNWEDIAREDTVLGDVERENTLLNDAATEGTLFEDIPTENTLLGGETNQTTPQADESSESGSDTSRRTFLKATGVATTTAAVGAGATDTVAAHEHGGHGPHETAHDPHDWGIDIEETIDGMTIKQKIAQMTQVDVGTFDPDSDSIPDRFGVDTLGEYFSDLELGSILTGGGTAPEFDPEQVMKDANVLQQYNLDSSSNAIPFLWGVDAVHGNGLIEGTTIFPHQINMGATRDPQLIEQAERHTADSVAAMGATWAFAPTNELQRDPRWGRYYEGLTEAPLLQGDIARAQVRGLEHNDRVAATDKHFAGYSIPDNGNDRASAQTSMRDFRTNLLTPHRMALEEDPKTVMVNSGAVNGKPAHASSWLLETVLRRRYGFDGVVISDYNDFNRLITNHDYVPDFRSAVRAGITAGIDVYMIGNGASSHGPVTFIETVADLVEDGEITEDRIDASVRRILSLKGELGLFEEPTVDESKISSVVGGAQGVSQQLTNESMVLLKNDPLTDDADPVLPLDDNDDILLTGPGYDPELDINNRFLMQYGGWTLGWQAIQSGSPTEDGPRPRGQTIADAMDDSVHGTFIDIRTDFRAVPFENAEPFSDDATPNGDFGFTDDQEADVRTAAGFVDAAVVVLGEGPHSEGFGDRDRFELAAAQRDIVRAITDEASDIPVVGVVLAGSPRGTAETFDMLDAVLFAGQPGSDGGRAVTETLLGGYNPAGKLAFNWPKSVGKVPNNFNAYPPLDDEDPLYAFGHGLSYTDFEYSNLSVSPDSVSNPARTLTVTMSVDVANTGDRHGGHIVEVFNTQSYGSVLQPNRRLMGYDRVALDPGESTTAEIEADLSAIEVVPGDVPGWQTKAVEAGDYELSVGDLTATLTVENTASVTDSQPAPGRYDLNNDGEVTNADAISLLRRTRGKSNNRHK